MAQYKRSDFELMAPAGSRESLAAAIAGGADSVYFGVGRLNMRAHAAGNLMAEEVPEIMGIVHGAGKKGYLTVNTVIYDEEIGEMESLIDAAVTAGVDAVIASDMAVVLACGKRGMPVHLSTQLNISNAAALAFYAQWADVAVLARELTLTQTAAIAQAVQMQPITGPSGAPVRLEMFCHGALCMAVSGKCYMSLHTRGKSANRGECLQNCRRTYDLVDRERGTQLRLENGYVMSPQDLKTIGFLDKMVASGVRVFKIEGRARGGDYVRTACECYDEALKAIADGTYTEASRTAWDDRLATVFNRGFWSGYYLGEETAKLVSSYGSCATEKKVFVGRCINFFAKKSIGQFELLAGSIRPGEKLLVTGPTTGAVYVTPALIMDDAGEVKEAGKGVSVTFAVPETVRANDKLYRIDATPHRAKEL